MWPGIPARWPRRSDQRRHPLSGTAEAATVTIYDGDTVLGTVVTGEDGRWTFTPDTLNEATTA